MEKRKRKTEREKAKQRERSPQRRRGRRERRSRRMGCVTPRKFAGHDISCPYKTGDGCEMEDEYAEERRQNAGATSEAGAGGADVFAQRADVGAVGADAAGVHGQAEDLRLLDAQAGVVKLGEAVAFGGHEAIAVRPIERARRSLHPRALHHDIEEIVPVPAVPHIALTSPVRRVSPNWMQQRPIR